MGEKLCQVRDGEGDSTNIAYTETGYFRQNFFDFFAEIFSFFLLSNWRIPRHSL